MVLSNIRRFEKGGFWRLECLLDGTAMFFESTHMQIDGERELLYDSFVVAVLPLMVERQENLSIQGSIDAILLKQLNEVILPGLSKINNVPLKLTISSLSTTKNGYLHQKAFIATGVSCGVDSFTTILEAVEVGFKYDCLTFFDAGSHGTYNAAGSILNYDYRLSNAILVSQKLNIPLVRVKTNAHDFLSFRFQSAHSFLNISCVFATMGFITEYRYASAYAVNQITSKSGDTSNYDYYLLPSLFSSYLRSESAITEMNRLQRINYISKFSLPLEHLDVCTNSVKAKQIGFINCSSCEKCMRTMATLETIGFLDKYNRVFNLVDYHQNMEKYLSRLLVGNKSIHDKELLSVYKFERKAKWKYYLTGYYLRIRFEISIFLKKLKLHSA